jgi:hypothetical protein
MNQTGKAADADGVELGRECRTITRGTDVLLSIVVARHSAKSYSLVTPPVVAGISVFRRTIRERLTSTKQPNYLLSMMSRCIAENIPSGSRARKQKERNFEGSKDTVLMLESRNQEAPNAFKRQQEEDFLWPELPSGGPSGSAESGLLGKQGPDTPEIGPPRVKKPSFLLGFLTAEKDQKSSLAW